MMMPFEWDVRVSSKDHTVTASTSKATITATARYTTMRDSTPRSCERRLEPRRSPKYPHQGATPLVLVGAR